MLPCICYMSCLNFHLLRTLCFFHRSSEHGSTRNTSGVIAPHLDYKWFRQNRGTF